MIVAYFASDSYESWLPALKQVMRIVLTVELGVGGCGS